MNDKSGFDPDLVKSYPRAHRKLTLGVRPFSLMNEERGLEEKAVTSFISPYGIEFQAPKDYQPGTLLKILINIPDYWARKQQFVEYGRIDNPSEFKVLAKVVNSEGVGKSGRRRRVLAQTVNIDEIDERVLKDFLAEGR